jgi:hypothetical protein
MPLKLVPPRPGKTPYWSVRGTYLGQHVDRSTKAAKRSVARQILEKWQREIECDEFRVAGEATFLSAAVAYMKSGGDRRPIKKLLEHFGEKLIVAAGTSVWCHVWTAPVLCRSTDWWRALTQRHVGSNSIGSTRSRNNSLQNHYFTVSWRLTCLGPFRPTSEFRRATNPTPRFPSSTGEPSTIRWPPAAGCGRPIP